jgi:hypothetical protein
MLVEVVETDVVGGVVVVGGTDVVVGCSVEVVVGGRVDVVVYTVIVSYPLPGQA